MPRLAVGDSPWPGAAPLAGPTSEMSDMPKTKQPEEPDADNCQQDPEQPKVKDDDRDLGHLDRDPDGDLWKAVKTWVAGRRYGEAGRVASALKQWATTKEHLPK